MNRLLRLANLCVLALAVALAVPAAAQTSSRTTDVQHTSMSASDSHLIPGTGMTAAELRDIGYTPDQIADLQNGALSANPTGNSRNVNRENGIADTNAASSTKANDNSSAAVKDNGNLSSGNTREASTDAASRNDSGGSHAGLWGLLGLLGLLGLGGRSRRAENVTDRAMLERERDRDVRRIA
jgi:MYXO-CTERM domain-containing protein